MIDHWNFKHLDLVEKEAADLDTHTELKRYPKQKWKSKPLREVCMSHQCFLSCPHKGITAQLGS